MAVFGGSFDPVHIGHLCLAGETVRLGLVDEVLFVPAAIPPHKQTRRLSSASHRMTMLQTALEPHARFSVSDIELADRDGPSFTYDTLRLLAGTFREHELFFLMGMDSLSDIHTWYRSGELVSQFRFIVFARPEIRPPSRGELASRFGHHHANRLIESIVNTRQIPVSATEVRQLAADNLPLAGLVPAAVESYIREHKLYVSNATATSARTRH